METVPSLILEVTSFFYATGLVFICSKEPGDGLQQHQLARQNLLSSLLIRRKNLTFKIRQEHNLNYCQTFNFVPIHFFDLLVEKEKTVTTIINDIRSKLQMIYDAYKGDNE